MSIQLKISLSILSYSKVLLCVFAAPMSNYAVLGYTDFRCCDYCLKEERPPLLFAEVSKGQKLMCHLCAVGDFAQQRAVQAQKKMWQKRQEAFKKQHEEAKEVYTQNTKAAVATLVNEHKNK